METTHANVSRIEWTDTSEELSPMLEANWLVHGLLPAEGIALIYGPSGVGKTFVTLDICCHVAAGKSFRNLPTKGGTVAYLALEGGRLTINRIIAWQQDHNAKTRLLLISQSIDLRSESKDCDALITELLNYNKENPAHPIVAVAVDTLNRAFNGGDENAPKDMGAFIDKLARIASELTCLVLVVHHSGKDVGKGSRGHSSLRAVANVEIQVKQLRDKSGILKVTKQRDGEDGIEIGFNLETVILGTDDNGVDVTTCVVADGDARELRKMNSGGQKPSGKHQRKLFDALRNLEADAIANKGLKGPPGGAFPVKEDDLYEEFCARSDAEKPKHRHRLDFDRALAAMAEKMPPLLIREDGYVGRS